MKTIDTIPDIAPSIELSHQFHHFVGGFIMDMPCIIAEKNRVYVHGYYDLVDFLNNGNLFVHKVKFMQAYKKKSVVKIIVYDFKTSELIERVHWMDDDDSQVCDWVLLEPDMFEPKKKKDGLLEFEF